MKKKTWVPIAIISSFFLGAGIALGLISSDTKAIEVKADTVNYVSYVSREWDEEEKCIKEIHSGVNATLINRQTSIGNGGWYYWGEGSDSVPYLGIQGEANIIVNDGHMWRLTDGIHVPVGSTLNIYGGPEGTGKIIAGPHSYYGAAIGGQKGDSKSGTINIYGGNISAYGGDNAAGIGGSEGCTSGDITIYGGELHVNGSPNGDDGAGIGGGENGSATNITIYGGYVSATGGKNAAGIGGGYKGNSGNIKIYGGEVWGDGQEDGAGIGSGEDGIFENIEIHGGTIKAVGGQYAAAIGSGDFDSDTENGTITITGGEITASGGKDAAGIGGGENGYGTINISGGTILKAIGGTDSTQVVWETVYSGGAGIGGGDGAPGGTINISGGTIEEAEGGYGGAGIGSGCRAADNSGGTVINISGSANITATGGENAAGIGGGRYEETPTINISGGAINATGGASGAGIGGGSGSGGNITISGGNITATAGSDSDGIGCGKASTGTDTATIRLKYDNPNKPFSIFSNSFYNTFNTNLIMENPFIDATNVIRYGAGTYTKTALNPFANIALTPEVRPILTLNPGGGKGNGSSEAVDYALVYTLPSSDTFAPETSACTFNNWQIVTGGNVFTKMPGETITITQDTTITATWTWDSSEVFNYADNFLEVVSCDPSNEPTFDEGWSWERLKNEYDALSSYSKNALKNASANENGDSVEKTVKIYDYIVGKYYKNGINLSYIDFFDRNPETVNVYSITYNLNGGTVSTPNPTSYDYATETFTLNNPTRYGYEFVGWYGEDIIGYAKEVTISKGETTGNKTYSAQWKLNENLQAVLDAIDDIDENNISYPNGNNEIANAESLYNALSEAEKEVLNNDFAAQINKLVSSRSGYNTDKDNYISSLVNSIDALGGPANIKYPDDNNAIVSIQNRLNNVLDEDLDLVTNRQTFLDILDVFEELKAAKIQEVIDMIDDIGEVEYPGSKDKVMAAYNAFYSIPEDDRYLITNEAILTTALTKYNSLLNEAVSNAIDLIDAIGEVKYQESEEAIIAARSAYDLLLEGEESLVTNYSTLEAAEARYSELVSKKAKADEFIALVEAVGDEVSYPDSKEAIQKVLDLYDDLDQETRGFVGQPILSSIGQKIFLFNNLRDAAMENAYAKISEIGEVNINSGEAIKEAREACDALDSEDKLSITNYETLLAAEARYSELVGYKTDAEAVDNLIDAIGEVSYPDSKESIEAARAAYDALSNDEQRGFVENLSILEDAETTYESLRNEAIGEVEGSIDSIGEVKYQESKDSIESARAAYDSLADEDKSSVSNYSTLVAAEARYSELVGYKADAEAVDNLIDAIGEVSYPDSKESIEAARAAYDALSNDEQRGFVEKLSVLEDAEITYESLRNEAIGGVEGSIDSIGEVKYQESKDAIETARAAYDSLADEDKSSVSNYSTLVAKENEYAQLREAAIDNAEELIGSIGEVKYQESKGTIESARAAYDALNEEDRSSVGNYSTLVAAENKYAELREAAIDNAEELIDSIGEVKYQESKDAIESARAAYDSLADEDKSSVSNYSSLVAAEAAYNAAKEFGASNVKELIDDIGTVGYTDSCKDKIESARAAYDALSEEQKALVDNYGTLIDAETTYGSLRNEAISEVEGLIDSIGDVSYSNSKEIIEEARTAYDALNEEDKASVGNYSTLVAAENKYAELREAAIDNVEESIDSIGEVKYQESKDAIETARAAYDSLADEDKSSVSNYSTLVAAEAAYNAAKESGASNVEELIDDIGTVGYTDSCKDKIESARAAYDALSEEQKALVDNYDTLIAAETAYESLRNEAISDVEESIDSIGEVKYQESKDAIETARAAYDSLADEDKSSVDNYLTLVAAENAYNAAKESGVNNVMELIDDIGTVGYTDSCKDKIESARAAYDALSEEQKALVDNYDKLTRAERVYKHVEEVADKIDAIWPVSIDSGEALEAAREAYNSLTEEEKELIPNLYETLVAKEKAHSELVNQKKTGTTLAITFGSVGGVSLLAVVAFVFKKFVFKL